MEGKVELARCVLVILADEDFRPGFCFHERVLATQNKRLDVEYIAWVYCSGNFIDLLFNFRVRSNSMRILIPLDDVQGLGSHLQRVQKCSKLLALEIVFKRVVVQRLIRDRLGVCDNVV